MPSRNTMIAMVMVPLAVILVFVAMLAVGFYSVRGSLQPQQLKSEVQGGQVQNNTCSFYFIVCLSGSKGSSTTQHTTSTTKSTTYNSSTTSLRNTTTISTTTHP
jgi:hypothetical protein